MQQWDITGVAGCGREIALYQVCEIRGPTMAETKVTLPEPMATLTAAQWVEMGVSQAEFAERWRMRLERDIRAPEIGAPAPDFDLEILSSAGQQTGEKFRLSSARGRPVGLIFGSYT